MGVISNMVCNIVTTYGLHSFAGLCLPFYFALRLAHRNRPATRAAVVARSPSPPGLQNLGVPCSHGRTVRTGDTQILETWWRWTAGNHCRSRCGSIPMCQAKSKVERKAKPRKGMKTICGHYIAYHI